MNQIKNMIYEQIIAFAEKNNLTVVNAGNNSWDILSIEQILISIELSFHNSKIIIELTGYLSTEISTSATTDILSIINSNSIKQQIENSNIELMGELLLNSKTLILESNISNNSKYFFLLELCDFNFNNKAISKLISMEYYQTFLVNLN